MPVDKRIPRVLNSDLDSKAVNKVSMEDALNLYSGPDNNDLQNGSKLDAGDQVLKNIKGNALVVAQESLPTNSRIVGAVEDVRTDITYLFVYSTAAIGHGIYAYDKYGLLPNSQPNTLRLIYVSKQFNFPQNGFVKADIVYTNASSTFRPFNLGEEFEKDAIIYFTDGLNEPRKINVYRAFLAQGHANIHGTGNRYSEADFICACPKTPLTPIAFQFDNDPTRSTSNFSTVPGFQFAYQYVYKDGTESAISPYSDVAFPPSIIFQGAAPYVDHSGYNVCNLFLPLPPETQGNSFFDQVTEVSSIKILAKQGPNGRFLIIDELDAKISPDDLVAENFDIYNGVWSYKYRFYNDKIGVGVSDLEVNKQYNAVPRRAKTQTVSSNRLMYGNYLDGFDSVKTKCEATVVYKEAPESFLTYNVKINPSIEPIGSPSSNKGKSVGFVLDFSGLPNEVSEGTEISLNFTISPDNNWHLYNFEDGGFQQTRQMGIQPQEGVNDLFDGVNFEQSLAQTNTQTGANFVSDNGGSIFGGTGNSGVKTLGQTWYVVDTTNPQAPSGINVGGSVTGYGTSAANPLIIKGGAIVFNYKIRANQDIADNARQIVNQAFHAAILGLDSDFGFEVISATQSAGYSFNAGLYSGKRIKQDFIGSDESNTSPEAKLITAVRTRLSNQTDPPGGYFIVNSADVAFTIKQVDYSNYPFVPNTSSHFRLRMSRVDNPDVYTCIHPTTDSNSVAHSTDWIAISKSDLILIENNTINGISAWLQSKGFDPELKFHLTPLNDNSTVETISRQIGYLKFPGVISIGPEFCLMDGEGGPGGGPCYGYDSDVNGYDKFKLYNQGSVTVNPIVSTDQTGQTVYGYQNTVFYSGEVGLFTAGSAPFSTVLPLMFRVSGSDYEYLLPAPDPLDTDKVSAKGPNFKRGHSPAEIISNSFYISSLESLASRSFKTEAMHDFGIIYYDQRGRQSFVNPLKTVFVDGYSGDERPGQGEGAGKGRVEIMLKLQHEPPSWAHFYKIAYSKNTSVADFIQYSAGGAFVKQDDEDIISDSNQNIYVSLNYLQSHPVSYAYSFGARTPEGGLNFYKFQEGDKLRVISYFDGENRVYRNYEFDVADVVNLGEDNNPLVIGVADPAENQKGDFVVLKNNPSAFGFTHGDVFSGAHNWGNNCIIEIRTPLKDLDADQRVFYEMPETYRIVRNPTTGLIKHEEADITLTQGDVWFRPVATNVREYENGQYVDFIEVNDGNDASPKPNFKNVFLETSTATDLFKADNIGLGRPNAVFRGAKETVREATITYSDASNPEGKKLNYSSFNPSTVNYKDLPESYGGIQYMGDRNDSIFVIQKDKISRVPVNRSVLSDISGNESLIASKAVLNEAMFYYGQNGCDTDPSSVFDSGEEVYFCNKTLSKVYVWSVGVGVKEISTKGISSLLRAGLKRAIQDNQQVRVVGGFDPLKEEYLLSVLDLEERTTVGVQYVVQPSSYPSGPQDDESDDVGPTDLELPSIYLNTNVVGFDPVFVEQTATAQLAVTNSGGGDLTISGLTFSDEVFSSSDVFPQIIPPGEFIFISLSFNSATATTYNETLTIVSNDPENPQYSVLLSASANEVETGDLVTAYNDLFGTNLTDDDMSAELAVEYLIALKNQPTEDHPTISQMQTLFLEFPNVSQQEIVSGLNILDEIGDVNNDGTTNIWDLLLYLEQVEVTPVVPETSVYNPTPVPGTGGPNPGVFVPGTGGEDPTPFVPGTGGEDPTPFVPGTGGPNPGPFDPPETGGEDPTPFVPGTGGEDPIPFEDPGDAFPNVDSAISYLLFRGDMTVGEFNVLMANLIPGINFNYNQDDRVGTADLTVFLAHWATSISPTDNAFIPNDPFVGSGNPFVSITSAQTIDFIISDGSLTVGQFYSLASHVKKKVLSDSDGDGNINVLDLNKFFEVYYNAAIQGPTWDLNQPALI